jgi:hypothetical protein
MTVTVDFGLLADLVWANRFGAIKGRASDLQLPSAGRSSMIILGLVLLLLGLVLNVGILTTIGIVLLVVGAVLALLGTAGRTFGGRRHFW